MDISSEEAVKLCTLIKDAQIPTPDKYTEFKISSLMKLYLILRCTKENVSIPEDVIASMAQTLLIQERSRMKPCMLCADMLSKLSQNITTGKQSIDEQQLPPKQIRGPMEKLLVQKRYIGCLRDKLASCVWWLSNACISHDLQQRLFTFILAVTALHATGLKDSDNLLDDVVHEIIMNTGLSEFLRPFVTNFTGTEENFLVSDQDPLQMQSFFAALNVGKSSSVDQTLSIFTYSKLYRWLVESHPRIPKIAAAEKEPQFVQTALAAKAVEHCLRMLDQCERKPTKTASDQDLQNICLMESVVVLDCVCRVDSAWVPQVFGEVKRLFGRLAKDTRQPRIILRIVQFFLNHSAEVVHDAQPAYNMYFGKVLTTHHSDPAVAFETVSFIVANLDILTHKTDILTRYCPNIMKIFAWHPKSFLTEFMEILPTFIINSSVIEVLHNLLDLPCITACLTLEHSPPTPQPAYPRATQQYLQPANALAFRFMLRVEGGRGDTIDRLGDMHSHLEDLGNHPRVFACAQTIPPLLQKYFNVVFAMGDYSMVKSLFPVVLERAGLLYNIPEYQHDIRRLFAENVCDACHQHPTLVSDESDEILDHIHNMRVLADRQHLYISLVWAVGEFCTSQVSSQVLRMYYEAIETQTYEICANMSATTLSASLLSSLISCLAKLATRSQDLIARVIICLTKVIQQQTNIRMAQDVKQTIVCRAQELVNLLRLPSFASVILNPDSDLTSGRRHMDPMSESVILRATHRIISSQIT